MESRRTIDHFKGCFLGGAVGDALGASVKFMSIDQIRSKFGEKGLTGYDEDRRYPGTVSDNTQTTLFTAEGLILSKIRREYQGDQGIVSAVYHALLRWLYTQKTELRGHLIQDHGTCSIVDGVLTGYKELFSRRSPEENCLSSLESGKMGSVSDPVNNSRAYGAVVRMAPAGLVYTDAEKAFHFGCRLAALTHGHPAGYLSSGTFSSLISLIASGYSLTNAIETACLILKSHKNHEEVMTAVGDAADLAGRHTPSPEVIESIGTGRQAKEALAAGIYCAMEYPADFRQAVLLAVNHSGNSSATGTVTGNILGSLHGSHIVPEIWLSGLELKDLIEETAKDLFDQFGE